MTWRRRSSLRFGLAFAGLFGAGTLILLLFLWFGIVGSMDRQIDTAIRRDGQALLDRGFEGIEPLLETIAMRLSGNVDDDAVYLVRDASGRLVAGNVDAWPAEVTEAGRLYSFSGRRHGSDTAIRAAGFDLPGGMSLLVGRDVQPRSVLLAPLAETLIGALLMLAGLGTAGGLLVHRLFSRMLTNISATTAIIATGDLSHRVRMSGRGDEFDRVAEVINDMLDRIERLMDGVRQVSNAIAHDLRTPITRARARLEGALQRPTADPPLEDAVSRAVQDLDGVTAVFQALLRIAEIEVGAGRSAFAPLDLVPLLQDLVELYYPVAEERSVSLHLAIPEALMMQGDRAMIQQAIANLMDNAIKFSPDGGAIVVHAEPCARITVADQGPGIPAADQERAAERFFRGDMARHTPGFGLGLTLVQAVAKLHGGRLLLEPARPGPRPGLRAVLVLSPDPGRSGRDGLLAESHDKDVPVRRMARV